MVMLGPQEMGWGVRRMEWRLDPLAAEHQRKGAGQVSPLS